MEIKKILFNGENTLKKVCKKYKTEDVNLKIKEDKVLITADETALNKVEILFNNEFFSKDALILGDAWERAYADLCFQKADPEKYLPWYFVAKDENKIYAFGVKTLPNAMCSWLIKDEGIVLNIDLRSGKNGVILNGREIEACRIVTKEYEGDVFDALCDFTKFMCDNPRKVKGPIYGGNDWYCNYSKNSHEKIVTMAERIAECAGIENGVAKENSPASKMTPYMVIDDGWQITHKSTRKGDEYSYNGGPWDKCGKNFNSMAETAKAISDLGVKPGIWFRPLLTIAELPDEYITRYDPVENGKMLDPSHPEVLKIVAEDVKRICSWGYKLIKHDFSTYDICEKWGSQMKEGFVGISDFYDKNKTTAEILKNFYKTIRDSASDDVLIMGCNTVSHLSAGIFDIQRTGDDTSGYEWERVKNYGVNTLAFRLPQHENFYQADADCVGITTAMDWNKNRMWLDVLAKSATPLFVSIGHDAYSQEVKEDITKAFINITNAEKTSRPLDFIENPIPEKWESDFGTDEYKW
ncbi:MAG: alpha-galactosidase [Ruminococcaceae bacterium]|nr:alpha-galactosidase [Oscillospiraceae bacterium]